MENLVVISTHGVETAKAIHTCEGFRQWLKVPSSATTHAELLDLCVVGFVSSRETEEPHRQLLAALDDTNTDHEALVEALAARVAALLRDFPLLNFQYRTEKTTPVSLPYEALSLAAALNRPAMLAAPLQACEAALRKNGAKLKLRTRTALLDALTRQQLANSPLRSLWLQMTAGKRDELLGGSPEMGMQGLYMIPDGNAHKPDRGALGEGLLAYAGVCKLDAPQRRQRFRRMVYQIREFWKLSSVFFIILADDFRWVENGHGWAVDALPELFVQDFGEVGPQNKPCWFVWHWFARAMMSLRPIDATNENLPARTVLGTLTKSLMRFLNPVAAFAGVLVSRRASEQSVKIAPAPEILGTFCGGRVILMKFETHQSEICERLRQQFIKIASGTAEISETEANQYVEQVMLLVAQSVRSKNREAADRLEQTRTDFVKEQRLEVSLLRDEDTVLQPA